MARGVSMQRDALLRFSPDVVFRELAGESVVLDLSSGRYFGMNAVGTRVWQLIGQGERVDALLRAVVAEYQADAPTIERDVLALLDDLATRGLVVEVPRGNT
jgi:trimethylamine:corrinoid methyltransferase-like protein